MVNPDQSVPDRNYARKLRSTLVPITAPLALLIVGVVIQIAIFLTAGGSFAGATISLALFEPALAAPLIVVASVLTTVSGIWLGVVLAYRTIAAHKARLGERSIEKEGRIEL